MTMVQEEGADATLGEDRQEIVLAMDTMSLLDSGTNGLIESELAKLV